VKELPSRLVLLGHPVHHSLSPAFQNAALRSAGLPLTYDALDITSDALPGVVRDLVAQRAAGNVTIPHKHHVAKFCGRLTPTARRVGAVNTFWVEDGLLVGDNTDVDGFRELLRAVVADIEHAGPVALLGAGGAAAAVIAALEVDHIGPVRVHNRDLGRAVELCARFGALARPAPTLDLALEGVATVVNATSVGLLDDAHPAPLAMLPNDAAVVDLVYKRGETSWVREARVRGHRAAGGMTMLLAQGAAAFERWFGIAPDRDAMRRAVTSR
jgi:shikimate dehydrogenase